MDGSPKKIPNVRVVFPFKFDLGIKIDVEHRFGKLDNNSNKFSSKNDFARVYKEKIKVCKQEAKVYVQKVKEYLLLKFSKKKCEQDDCRKLGKIGLYEFLDRIKEINDVPFPDPQIDHLLPWEHFARSYLSIRVPSISLNSQKYAPITINLDGESKSIEFNRTVRIYPEQGVISIILSYEFSDISISQLKAFYNIFSEERSRGYAFYLDKKICVDKNSLAEYNKTSNRDIEDNSLKLNLYKNIYDVVEILRSNLIKDSDGQSNYKCDHNCSKNLNCDLYCFENYRTLFFINDDLSKKFKYIKKYTETNDNSDYLDLYTLLTGFEKTKLHEDIARYIVNESITSYQDKLILTGVWATVFLLNKDENNSQNSEGKNYQTIAGKNPQNDDFSKSFGEQALSLFDYAHTLWFICQKWIYSFPECFYEIDKLYEDLKQAESDNRIDQKEYERLIDQYSSLNINMHKHIGSIQKSLIEVKDVDLMFFNSEYRTIMQKFYDALKIMNHINLIESNLAILDSFNQRLKDSIVYKHSVGKDDINYKISRSSRTSSLILGTLSGFSIANLFRDLPISCLNITIAGVYLPLLGLFFSLSLLFIIYAFNRLYEKLFIKQQNFQN